MTTSAEVASVVEAIVPGDDVERRHREDALAWLRSTGDVFRRVSPRTPPKHLVSYVVLHDETEGSVLLVDHRKSGLWLPAGGHVEPGEDPADAAVREAAEELGVAVASAGSSWTPAFVTVTATVGDVEDRHVDVSFWYVLSRSRCTALVVDARELAGARWWTRQELDEAGPAGFEPHLGRFLIKLGSGRPNPPLLST